MNKSFEDQWKDALGDACQTPPPEIWDRVEAELNKKKNRFFIWKNPARKKTVFFSGVAAALALVLGATFFLINTPVEQNVTVEHSEKLLQEPLYVEEAEQIAALPASAHQKQLQPAETKEALETKAQPLELMPTEAPVLVKPGSTTKATYQLLASMSYEPTITKFPLPSVEAPSTPERVKQAADKKLRIGFIAANAPFNPNFSAPGFQQQAVSAVQSSDVLLSFNKGGSGGDGFYTNSSRTDAQSVFEQGQSMGFGITVARKLKKRVSLESGIKFTRATASHTSNVYAVNSKTGQTESFSHANYLQSGNEISDVLISVSGTSRYSYHFLSVPLLLNYELLNLGKLQMNAVGGLSNEFLVSGAVVNSKQNEQHFNGGNSNFRTINIAGVGGLRVSYPVTSQLDINLGGMYQHFLTSGLKNNSQATFRPSMLGINLGLSIRQ